MNQNLSLIQIRSAHTEYVFIVYMFTFQMIAAMITYLMIVLSVENGLSEPKQNYN